MPSSGVLILIIGSNTKKRGGAKNYNRELSIVASLPPTAASLLVQGRRRILQLITQGGYSRNKVRLADMPSNTTLVNGPEFGGDAQDGLYMPATGRFHGRFFDRLGPNSIELLTNTRHHVLIVTPLYGLVAPSEPIQDRQCHINDHPNFRRVWTQDDRLTDVLLAYMRRHGITHVLDLTAQNSYRLLIAWERARAEAKKVLHCFGTQTAGSDFLIPLGFLCREILSKGTEEKITSITHGTYFDTPYEQLLFLSSPRPPADAPQELEAQQSALNMADELGRMRRCIIRIVSALDSSVEQLGESGITSKVRRLARSKLIPSVIETHMLTIIRTRNDVEYGRSLQISESRVQAARAAHSEIKKWAQSRKISLPNECLEI